MRIKTEQSGKSNFCVTAATKNKTHLWRRDRLLVGFALARRCLHIRSTGVVILGIHIFILVAA